MNEELCKVLLKEVEELNEKINQTLTDVEFFLFQEGVNVNFSVLKKY